MKDDKIVFCDTGFVIRLLDETNELHNNALGYYKYFLENDYILPWAVVVEDAVGHVATLLHLRHHRSSADGMYTSCRNEEHVAALHFVTHEYIGDAAVLYPLRIFVLADE